MCGQFYFKYFIRERDKFQLIYTLHYECRLHVVCMSFVLKTSVDLRTNNFLFVTGVVEDPFVGCESPTDVYRVLVEPIIGPIVFQSNLYATQRGRNLYLSEKEFFSFIGINFLMGYHKLPNWRDYWSGSEDMGVPLVSRIMSRDRFDSILTNLHVNDNQTMPNPNPDRLYKLRPMIDTLNMTFKTFYNGTREKSVDESMVLFKGRSFLKQYNPMKPIKRGYKLWCLADQKGYISKFKVYQGKDELVEQEFDNFGLGERVVLELTKQIWGQNNIVFFDNYFTSITLLERLKIENVLACGTIRQNRKGMPNNLTADKNLQRGEFDYRISKLGISTFKWKDNRIVHFASNYHGSDEASVMRRARDGSRSEIRCPLIVKHYNSHMGGVDLADQLRSSYCVDRKSRKWWHRLFWAFLDIAFVNAYVIYNELYDPITLKEYRRSVCRGLMSEGATPGTSRKQKVACNKRNNLEVAGPSKRRKLDFSIPKDVRHGNRGCHWVTFGKKRGRCEICSKKKVESRPYSTCSTCKVHLCCNEKKNCFSEFHGVG